MSESSKYNSSSYRLYVLGFLTLVYAVNFVDRQLLVILQESIKADLNLSDTQLGLLTGFTFALFYVIAGIPIARWADRGNRRNIISLSLGVWSLMTAVSGLVGSYVQLLLARIGVGIGEAGCSPPAHSIISDIFPAKVRASAMSFYSIGINIGIMFGFLLGGFLNDIVGWRNAFLIVGLPGILLALLLRFSVAEPKRGLSEQREVAESTIPFGAAIKTIFGHRYLVHMSLGAGLSALAGYGFTNWAGSFMIRTHQMTASEAGFILAIGIGVFGAIGTFAWGVLSDRFAKKHAKWYALLPAMAIMLAVIPTLITLLSNDKTVVVIVGLMPAIFTTGYLGASLAVFHSTVEPRMRATASAVFFLILNIIGLGCGPTLVGFISDMLRSYPQFQDESLRYAMIIVLPTAFIWSSFHFYLASRSMPQKLGAQQ